MKQIDETAGRVGAAMRTARDACHMSSDLAASLLRIMPDELARYERGMAVMPVDILQRMFIMGYKMIFVRALDYRYITHRRLLRNMKRAATAAE